MSQGFELNGRKFVYRTPTIAFVRKVDSRNYEPILSQFGSAMMSKKQGRKFDRTWRRFCNDVLVRDNRLWKWFGIVPKELRSSEIPLLRVIEVTQGFFAMLEATLKELDAQVKSLVASRATAKQ